MDACLKFKGYLFAACRISAGKTPPAAVQRRQIVASREQQPVKKTPKQSGMVKRVEAVALAFEAADL
jgi:hypothetical protein